MSKKWQREALNLAFTTNLSWRKIAKKIGVAKSTVSDFLRKAKLDDEFIDSPLTESNKPKILSIDIETSKILAYVWNMFPKYVPIEDIVEDWYVICWSAKWLGDDEVMNSSVHHYTPLEEVGRYRFNEEHVIRAIWRLLDEADIVIAHNLKKFDKKKLNAKFFEYDLPEPSPYKSVDTLLIAQGNFAMTSNKLDYITKLKLGGGKHKTDNQLWIDCMNDDVPQLDRMQAYCDNDVVELEHIYLKMRHWDKNAPNLALYYDDDKVRCNSCGSDKLTPLENKTANTNLSKFSVLRCDGCGKILRDRENILSKDKRKSLLMSVR